MKRVDWQRDTPLQLAIRTGNPLWMSPLLVWDTDRPLKLALSPRYDHVRIVRNHKPDLYEFIAIVGDMDKLLEISLQEWKDIYNFFYTHIHPIFPDRIKGPSPVYVFPKDVEEFYTSSQHYLIQQEVCKYLLPELACLSLAYVRENKIPMSVEKAIPDPYLLDLIEEYARDPLLRPKIIQFLHKDGWCDSIILRPLLIIAVLEKDFPPFSPQQIREVKEKIGKDGLYHEMLRSLDIRYHVEGIHPLLNILNNDQLAYMYSCIQQGYFSSYLFQLKTAMGSADEDNTPMYI